MNYVNFMEDSARLHLRERYPKKQNSYSSESSATTTTRHSETTTRADREGMCTWSHAVKAFFNFVPRSANITPLPGLTGFSIGFVGSGRFSLFLRFFVLGKSSFPCSLWPAAFVRIGTTGHAAVIELTRQIQTKLGTDLLGFYWTGQWLLEVMMEMIG